MLGQDVVMANVQWIMFGQRYHFSFKLFVEDGTKLLTRLIFNLVLPMNLHLLK